MTNAALPATTRPTPGMLLLGAVMLVLGFGFPVWAIVQLAAHGPNPFMVLFVAFSALAFSALLVHSTRYRAVVHEIDRFFDVLIIGYFSYQLLYVGVSFWPLLWLATFLFTFIFTLVKDLQAH